MRSRKLRLDDPNKPLEPDKGEFQGSCNRRACQKPGADYYNKYTYKYYCKPCAFRINSCNREEVCTRGEHESLSDL